MNNVEAPTIEQARSAADRGELATWVAEFLASPGSDNAALAEQLERSVDTWMGPYELPLDRLHRLAGGGDQPTIEPMGDEGLETVDGMIESIDGGWEPAPLVVTINLEYRQLVVEDGNHRAEALRRVGRDRAWAVVGFADDDERQWFDAEWGDALS